MIISMKAGTRLVSVSLYNRPRKAQSFQYPRKGNCTQWLYMSHDLLFQTALWLQGLRKLLLRECYYALLKFVLFTEVNEVSDLGQRMLS